MRGMTLGPLMIDLKGVAIEPDERDLLLHPLVGGVILFSRNYESPEQLSRLTAELRGLRTPSLLIGVDHEGGRVQRFREGFTRLPPLRAIGRRHAQEPAAGVALARDLGWLMAAELRACGVDLSFAPCVDLDFGVSEVIGDRAFHRRAERVSELAVAYLFGMREAGMAATAKHFPGHGAVTADSHVALPVDRRPLADLEPDLMPYRRLIANGLLSVMAAHVVFPDVDERPASLSRRWIQGELRGTLGFRGAVFTDDLSMKGAAAFGSIVERTMLALEAGCDMLPVCNDRRAIETVLEGLRDEADPLRAVRLARLHGRTAPGLHELRSAQRWRDGVTSAAHCLDVPELRLDA
jgi:beta-N-acetylhexosaminidase